MANIKYILVQKTIIKVTEETKYEELLVSDDIMDILNRLMEELKIDHDHYCSIEMTDAKSLVSETFDRTYIYSIETKGDAEVQEMETAKDVVRGHRLTNTEAMDMQMREIDNALTLCEKASESIRALDDVKYFCCGVDVYMLPCVYTTKGSLWFEDKKAGKLVATNDSVTEYNIIRLVFELETEFNWLWDHKLSDFNFKIGFYEECNEIHLVLWRKE